MSDGLRHRNISASIQNFTPTISVTAFMYTISRINFYHVGLSFFSAVILLLVWPLRFAAMGICFCRVSVLLFFLQENTFRFLTFCIDFKFIVEFFVLETIRSRPQLTPATVLSGHVFKIFGFLFWSLL